MEVPFHAQILKAFCDPELPAYGQVATVDAHNNPQVRTVHCHYLKDKLVMAFNANIKSNKWKEVEHHPYISGCYFDMVQMIQFRWEGPVQFLMKNISGMSPCHSCESR